MDERQPSSPGRPWWQDRRVYAWASWDFATTPFSALISTVIYPAFFKEICMQGAREGDFIWGLTGSLAMLLVVVLAPAAGAYADAAAAKRQFLIACTALNVTATALFATLGPGTVAAGMALYILAGLGYQGGTVFYNAFLPEVAPVDRRGAVSGLGDGLGYVGALLAMGIVLPYLRGTQEGVVSQSMAPVFLFVAAFALLFSLPTFLLVRDRMPPASRGGVSITGALSRQWATLRHLRRYGNTFRFLLTYLLYTDAVTTMSLFVTIYARSRNVSMEEIVLIFLLSQITAAPGTLLMGRLADRIGAKPTIAILIGLWLVLLGYGIFAHTFTDFLIIGLMAGVGVGALTTVSRAMMTLVSPPAHQAEFFGFFAVAGRASAVLGPPLFGAISSLTGDARYALPALMALLVAALFLLRGVEVERLHRRVPSAR